MLTIAGSAIQRLEQFLHKQHVLFSAVCVLSLVGQCMGIGEVIWAVNCGGSSHTDVQGIRYQADPQKIGQASDYGKSLLIQRVVPQDQILYQTERYHMSTFGYDVPLSKDGDYVIVLKFSEVWFTAPNRKVIHRDPLLYCAILLYDMHNYYQLVTKDYNSNNGRV